MNKSLTNQSNFKLWVQIGKLSHSIILARQRELSQHGVPVRQYQVLRIIEDLGAKATLSRISLEAERTPNVISRQTIRMEKDGLLKRSKYKPKSNLLTLELTQKGLDILSIAKKSKSIDGIFLILSLEERNQLESTIKKLINAIN